MFRGGGIHKVKAQAPTAIAFLLIGLALGLIANPAATRPPTTHTVTERAIQTVTVAQTTVQERNRPAPYSVSAQYICLVKGPPAEDISNITLPQGCPEPHTKAISITVRFTELGTERSYIPRDGVVVMTPGLTPTALVDGYPVDPFGKIVIQPGRFDTAANVVVEVEDLYSFVNWMRDVGKITLIFKIVDGDNQHIQDVSVEGIVPFAGAWSIESAEQEVGGGG